MSCGPWPADASRWCWWPPGTWQESDIPVSSEDERAAWNLVRQAFRYGLAGTSPAAWLTRHGWTPGQTTTVTELARRHGQPVHYALASSPRVWLFNGTLG